MTTRYAPVRGISSARQARGLDEWLKKSMNGHSVRVAVGWCSERVLTTSHAQGSCSPSALYRATRASSRRLAGGGRRSTAGLGHSSGCVEKEAGRVEIHGVQGVLGRGARRAAAMRACGVGAATGWVEKRRRVWELRRRGRGQCAMAVEAGMGAVVRIMVPVVGVWEGVMEVVLRPCAARAWWRVACGADMAWDVREVECVRRGTCERWIARDGARGGVKVVVQRTLVGCYIST